MDYGFDSPVNRRGTNSAKWEVAESELPMWVADMDFQAAPEIRKAIQERAEHGVYGYATLPEEWRQAIAGWWKKRHGFQMDKEWLLFCTGVVPALSSMIRKLTSVGDSVLVQSPVYHAFFRSIENNGRRIIDSPLEYNGVSYSINFEDLERKLAQPQTTMMLLCNPHNPVGKIWDAESLRRIGELCWKHHVLVLSDEIHCDLTEPGQEYVPFASVSEQCRENSVTCIAPTKTFNLAALQTAAVMVPNEALRHKAALALNTDEIAEPNAFAVPAAIAAYTQGEPWLDALREYLYGNKKHVTEYLEKEIPRIKPVSSKASYLLWLDCGDLTGYATRMAPFLRAKTGLYLSDGEQFGANGSNFLRMNIACPRVVLEDGLTRLKKGVEAYFG